MSPVASEIAPRVVDTLGAQCSRGELRNMVRALSFHSHANTVAEQERLRAAKWAQRNWAAYLNECDRRRDRRRMPLQA